MDRWMELVSEALEGAPVAAPDLCAELLGADGRSCTLHVEQGALRLSEGADGTAAVAVRSDLVDLEALVCADPTTWWTQGRQIRTGDDWVGALPDIAVPGTFEPIPRATMTVVAEVRDTVAGFVGLIERWEDGVLVRQSVSGVDSLTTVRPEIAISCTLGHLVAIRTDRATPLEVLAGGVGIVGDWPVLMCYAELVRHEALLAAWGRRSAVDVELALGAVLCSDAFLQAAGSARVGAGPAAGATGAAS